MREGTENWKLRKALGAAAAGAGHRPLYYKAAQSLLETGAPNWEDSETGFYKTEARCGFLSEFALLPLKEQPPASPN